MTLGRWNSSGSFHLLLTGRKWQPHMTEVLGSSAFLATRVFPASPHSYSWTQPWYPELPLSPRSHVRVCVRESLLVLRLKPKQLLFSAWRAARSSQPAWGGRLFSPKVPDVKHEENIWGGQSLQAFWRNKFQILCFSAIPTRIATFPCCQSSLEATMADHVLHRFSKVPVWWRGSS